MQGQRRRRPGKPEFKFSPPFLLLDKSVEDLVSRGGGGGVGEPVGGLVEEAEENQADHHHHHHPHHHHHLRRPKLLWSTNWQITEFVKKPT